VGALVNGARAKPCSSRGRTAASGIALLVLVFAVGCRGGVSMSVEGADQPEPAAGIDFGKFNKTPKPRIGSLPWPGAFTLFELADPDHLGHHAYDEETAGEPEQIRGILYTCRGGFIDIAHTRKSADLCKYAAVRIEFALMNDWTALKLKSLEPSVYVLHLNYPPFWKSLSADEKQRLARELSIRLGQRVALVMITWHEVLTWFGYKATIVLPERQSAFTYDDVSSHAIGVMVGGRALRDPDHDWDTAVTLAINAALRELGVVTPDQAMVAIDKVKDAWWRGFEPLKRQFELGWQQPTEAWIVRDLPFCHDAQPYRFELPRHDDVMGRDFTGLLRIEIEPNVLESGKIRGVIPGKPPVVDVDKHLPIIMDHMRQWHVERSGEQVLRPY
jgi:hypothetical protein